MGGCLVYVVAAVALWRLWGSGYSYLWWGVLAAAVLNAWTEATVKTAHRQERDVLLSENPGSSPAEAEREARSSSVVIFWIIANMVVLAVTAVLSVVGLVLSFF